MNENEHKKELITDDEIDLTQLLMPLLENINFIIKICIYAFLLSALISLILPPIYRSSATILPPQPQSSVSSQILSQLAGLGGGISLPGAKDVLELYRELLGSNSVVDYVIEKNDLYGVYKKSKDEKDILRDHVKKNTSVDINRKSGTLKVSYDSKDPELSFKVVLSLIEGLKNINNKLAITEASQRRLFYEEQLEKAKENLIKAEEELKRFQQKTGTIKIDEEAKAAAEEIARIRAQISFKEVQLKAMQGYVTTENPDYKKLVDEISALKDQLSKLQSKIPDDDESRLSTKKVSVYGIEYIRKMREFKYNESLYEILLKQYEAARLDESKDATIIQVIEDPEIPQKRYKPKRKLIVSVSTFTALFLAVIWIYLKIFIQNIKNSNPVLKDISVKSLIKISEIKNDIKNDIKKIIKLFIKKDNI